MEENEKQHQNSKDYKTEGNSGGNETRIEIRSGEVQEILGGVPSWIVRYGTLMFVAVIVLIILFSFIFNYPDILRSNIVVTTENPPATLVARTTGKIDKLFVRDNEKVNSGEIIALIENPANFKDVLRLQTIIDSVQPHFDTLNFTPSIKFDNNLSLGSVQEYYSQFLTKYYELLNFLKQNYYQDMNRSLLEQLDMAGRLYSRLREKRTTVQKEYEIKKQHYDNQLKLFAREVLSIVELKKAESDMLSKKSELDQLLADLEQKQIDMRELEQEILDNEKTYKDMINKLQTEMMETFNNLKSEISNWELDYLLRTPIEGTVSFNKIWSVNQNVTEGENVFTVVPDNVGELIGKVELPVRGSGKVKTELNVNVKFDNYPYMQYGLVRAKVSNVSLVPEDNFYMVEVYFPNGLVTNYGKDLSRQNQLQNQLIGQAEIITEDLKLIQRIFNPIKALWKERVKS